MKTLISFIRKNHAVNVVTGMPQSRNSILVKMWEKLKEVSFFTVDEDGKFVNMSQQYARGKGTLLHPNSSKVNNEIA